MRLPAFSPLAALAVLVLAGLVPARAGDAPRVTGVVELFTSQGCSSCPPADKVLAELGRRADLIVLGYHVDYWDYLGWSDTLGAAASTERQRLYMRALKNRSVYTPQAVVNGRMHLNGSNRDGLLRSLKEMALADAGPSVPLAVSRTADGVTVEAGGLPDGRCAGAKRANLFLVFFAAPQPVRIATGENEGHTIIYWNPVARIEPVGLWHRVPARFELPAAALPDDLGAVALLQAVDAEGLPGAILGAAVIRLPKQAAEARR